MVITINRIQCDLVQPIARTYIFIATIMALPTCASASDWTFTPSLYMRGSYSDNVQLVSGANAKSDFVKEVKPAISITGNNERIKLDLFYNLQKLFYLHRQNSLHHELAANTEAELLDDWLFLDARVSNSRRNISAFGSQAFDNIQQSVNQSDVRTSHLSPFLRHYFPKFAIVELRFAHDTVHSGGNFLNVTTDKVFFKLLGDNLGPNWNWDAYYNINEINDVQLNKERGHSEALSLRHKVSGRFAWFVTKGYESEGYNASSGDNPQGGFWSVGAHWRSNRSDLSLSVGERFFGKTYSLSTSRRGQKSIWSVVYGEDITSTASEFLRLSQSDVGNLLNELWSEKIPNPIARKQVVKTFLDTSKLPGFDRGAINYFTRSYFLQKQLRLSVAAMSAKSTVLMAISATRRLAQTNYVIGSKLLPLNQQISNSDTTQIGASASWNWRMSTRTSNNLGITYDRTTDKSQRRDNNFVIVIGLNRALARNVTGSFDLRHMRHNSTQSGASYRENGISAALNFQL